MAFTVDTPETIGGESTYLEGTKENEGHYHLIVNDAVENGVRKKDGEVSAIEGFSVECEVCEGAHEGKKIGITFFNGKSSSKDGGAMARKKQAAFLIATDLMKPDQLGKAVSIDLNDAIGSHFVAELRLGQARTDNQGKERQNLEVHYANVYHIDDPRARKYVSESIAAGIPAENRHGEDYFATLVAKKAEPAKKTTTVSDDDFAGL